MCDKHKSFLPVLGKPLHCWNLAAHVISPFRSDYGVLSSQIFSIIFGDVVTSFMACFPKCITLVTIMCFNVFMSNMWMFKYALMIDVYREGQLVWIMIPRLLQGVVCGKATLSSVLHVADDIMRMEIGNVQLHFGAVDAAIVCMSDIYSMYSAHWAL